MKKKTTNPPTVTTEESKQEQLLSEAKQLINVQAFQMKRALDTNNFKDALKNASNIILELRTSVLSPKTYYALYIFTVDQLRHLEAYISEGAHGRPLLELYELMQFAGNILPRLYLMVTVGAVFIKKMGAPANLVLKDLVELCRGVQHPTRGLFLRTYLSEMMKDKLPDEGSKYEGDVKDSIEFILINFTEMNKLWVRMQHGVSNLTKREQEREELNVLVGKNLSRLSQLDGLTKDLYKDFVLPKILLQIVQCTDRIAQQYLMVIVIQVFSDEFQLHTAPQILETCSKLEDDVKLHSILISLIDRVSNFCLTNARLHADDNLFQMFKTKIEDIAKSRVTMPLEEVIEMTNALVAFSCRCYKDNIEQLDSVYKLILSYTEQNKYSPEHKPIIQQMINALQTPIVHYKSVRPALGLKHFPLIFSLLPLQEKRNMSLFMLEHVFRNNTHLVTVDEVVTFLQYLTPIAKRPADADPLSSDDWESDQFYVSRVITSFYTSDIESMYNILLKTKDYFTDQPKVDVRFSLVPLIYHGLHIVQNLHKQKEEDSLWEKKAQKVCKTIKDLVTLVQSPRTLFLTFQLHLQCALQTGKCGMGNHAFGFLTTGALSIYEDSLVDTPDNYEAIRQLSGVIQSIKCFDIESSEKLAKRIAQHSNKILSVEQQCRAIILSSHLFLSGSLSGGSSDNGGSSTVVWRDTKSALSCLKKTLTIIQTMVDVDMKSTMLLELLDQFLYFFTMDPDVVEPGIINLFTVKVMNHFSENNSTTTTQQQQTIVSYLTNIKEHVKNRKKWENLLKKEKTREVNSELGLEVEGEVGLTESEAKKESSRWKEIQFETE